MVLYLWLPQLRPWRHRRTEACGPARRGTARGFPTRANCAVPRDSGTRHLQLELIFLTRQNHRQLTTILTELKTVASVAILAASLVLVVFVVVVALSAVDAEPLPDKQSQRKFQHLQQQLLQLQVQIQREPCKLIKSGCWKIEWAWAKVAWAESYGKNDDLCGKANVKCLIPGPSVCTEICRPNGI